RRDTGVQWTCLVPRLVMSFLLLFYVYSPVRHPHLHSFPTRRSSDLTFFPEAAISRLRVDRHACLPGQFSRRLRCRHTRSKAGWRSEEHTSELQSLAYLVCRLLLEKKKTTF